MSYDRMVRAESELAGQVEALLAEAQDAAYGPDCRGDELPVELARRKGRLAAIRAAKAALEAEAAAKARAQAEQEAGEQGRDPDQVTAAGDAARPPRSSRTGRNAHSPTRTRGSENFGRVVPLLLQRSGGRG